MFTIEMEDGCEAPEKPCSLYFLKFVKFNIKLYFYLTKNTASIYSKKI